MPNWCSTSVKIVGDKESLNKLHIILDEMQNREDPKTSDFGQMWLGELVKKLGGDIEKVYCRGWIDWYESNDEELSLTYESAWAPMFDVHSLIREKFPNVAIYYQAEESGMSIYETNDDTRQYFPEKFYLWVEDCETQYHESLDELVKDVEQITGSKNLKTFDSCLKALETYSRHQHDLCYTLEEFKVVDE